MTKPLVYLAGPYTKGDQAINTRAQLLIAHELMDDDTVTPYAPLISHFMHCLIPRKYGDWMEHSYAMLSVCDAVLRSSATCGRTGYFQHESHGADLEEAFCKEHSIPVFYLKDDLYDWAKKQNADV